MNKVLVVAPGRKTRGGITAVVKEYEKADIWKEYGCRWIESYIDKTPLHKILWFIRGYLIYLYWLPGCKLVHLHLSEPTSIRRKALFFWPAHWLGKKIILHFHAFSPDTTIRGPFRRLYRKLFIGADAVVLLSETWNREVCSAFGDAVHTSVIYNPNCSEAAGASPIPDNWNRKPYILYAGTLNRRKGFMDLIKAFSIIGMKYPDWYLIIAGNGEIEQGRNLAASLGIGAQVQFKGWVEGKEKERLFREGSIFCLPSYAEGFPMSVIEAWSYGLPVVTTPVGGLPDVIEHRHNAMVFEPGDLETLAHHLTELISDEKLRNDLSNESSMLSKTLFSIETITREMEDLYDTLLGQST